MAGAAPFYVTVKGKGGHGSWPDISVSPIFARSCILNNLAAAWVDQIDANETVTLGIANIHSGTDVANIIPETAKMHHCTVEFDPRT